MSQSTQRRSIRRIILPAAAAAIVALTAAIHPSLAIAAEGDDVTAPVITLDYPEEPATGYYRGPVTVRVTASDDTGIVSWHSNIDEVISTPSGPFEHTFTADGIHYVNVIVEDAAGNRAVQFALFRIDTTAPRIFVASPTQFAVGDGNARVQYTCEDDTSRVASCSAPVPTGTPVDTSAPGVYEVPIVAQDIAGNESSHIYRYEVVEADAELPTASIAVFGSLHSGWYNDLPRVRVSASDDTGVSAIEFTATGAYEAAYTIDPEEIVGVPAEGITDISAVAIDRVGNRSEPAITTVSVDVTDPTVTFGALTHDGSIPEVGLGKEVFVSYTCEDATSGVGTCEADQQQKSLEGEAELDTSELGEHTLTVTATDMAGNAHSEVLTYVVAAVDAEVPVLEYDVPDPEESGWYRGDVNISVSASDNEAVDHIDWATFGAQAGEGVFGAEGGTVTINTDGETEMRMFATDTQQNVGELEKVAVKRDATAPTITAGLHGEDASTFLFRQGVTATLGIQCSDATSGIEQCETSSGELSEDGLLLIDTTELGEFTVTVTAQDVAGNETSRELTYTVVDAPSTGSTASSSGGSTPTLAATGGALSPVFPLTAVGLLAAGVLALIARKRRS